MTRTCCKTAAKHKRDRCCGNVFVTLMTRSRGRDSQLMTACDKHHHDNNTHCYKINSCPLTRNCCKMAARHKKIPAVCVRLLLEIWVENTGVIASANWNLGRTTRFQRCGRATPTVVAPWSSHATALGSCLGGAVSECCRAPTPAFLKLF